VTFDREAPFELRI
jgi:hypothetical protein